MQDQDGQVGALLRTYLQDGHKALGAESKKLLCGGVNGAAIRLGEPACEMSVCEGVETGLAIQKRTGQPVWGGICAATWNASGSRPGDAAAHLWRQRRRRHGRRPSPMRTWSKLLCMSWRSVSVARRCSAMASFSERKPASIRCCMVTSVPASVSTVTFKRMMRPSWS